MEYGTNVMKLKFWGVRGSIPSPGPNTVKYGGNTLCLELRLPDQDRLIIFDAGSGIRELGDSLSFSQDATHRLNKEIFLTHTHLDHILGLPFFAPIHNPATHLKIYGPVTCEEDPLEEVLAVSCLIGIFRFASTNWVRVSNILILRKEPTILARELALKQNT